MKKLTLTTILLLFGVVAEGNAQDIEDKVKFHGFGSWAYGKTDGNRYQLGSKDGEYRNTQFALNLAADPFKNLVINAQLDFEQEGESKFETDLDFAFAELRFSDQARLRVGLVKQPFGIYTEIFDIGTVRPFLTLPQSIYDSAGFIGEGYRGIGLTGAVYRKSGWGFQYDVYGGSIDLRQDDDHFSIFEEGDGEDEEGAEEETEARETINELLGGRFVVHAPLKGLSFGVSGYTGKPTEHRDLRHSAYGIHGEYLSDLWSVRSEFARRTEQAVNVNAYYLEAAYRLTPKWQIAGRYDWLDADIKGVDTSEAPSLLRHKDFAVGLNYWFNDNIVLKSSYHYGKGNRFALPESVSLHEVIESGRLDPKTNLFQFGVQFSF